MDLLEKLTYENAMVDHAETVGARIRAARAERRLTQSELAEAVGVTRSAVAQWETERAGQVRGNLTRIAAVLGVTVGYLLHGNSGGTEPPPENATEVALLRLYRACTEDDRAFLLRTATRLARAAEREG
jgi:transcriptional regulator with XRE-family HTH domain